jgi:cell division protein FtsL
MHYDSYNRAAEIQNREETMNNFISGGSYEARPSSTTMQFKDMPRAEIYQDYRQETAYYTQTKVKSSAKILMVTLTIVVMLLSALVIFNTSLLTTLSATISGKESQAQALQEELLTLQEELSDVTSPENIIDAATDIGMVKKGE